MPAFPRYFCIGSKYDPPSEYFRVDAPEKTVLVDPSGEQEVPKSYSLQYFLQKNRDQGFAEVTLEEIENAIDKWRRAETKEIPRLD